MPAARLNLPKSLFDPPEAGRHEGLKTPSCQRRGRGRLNLSKIHTAAAIKGFDLSVGGRYNYLWLLNYMF